MKDVYTALQGHLRLEGGQLPPLPQCSIGASLTKKYKSEKENTTYFNNKSTEFRKIPMSNQWKKSRKITQDVNSQTKLFKIFQAGHAPGPPWKHSAPSTPVRLHPRLHCWLFIKRKPQLTHEFHETYDSVTLFFMKKAHFLILAGSAFYRPIIFGNMHILLISENELFS